MLGWQVVIPYFCFMPTSQTVSSGPSCYFATKLHFSHPSNVFLESFLHRSDLVPSDLLRQTATKTSNNVGSTASCHLHLWIVSYSYLRSHACSLRPKQNISIQPSIPRTALCLHPRAVPKSGSIPLSSNSNVSAPASHDSYAGTASRSR